MIAPQNPTPVPNAVFTPSVNLAVSVASGTPVVRTVQLTFQAAAVSAGKWQPIDGAKPCQPFSFGFDSAGNITGLPPDLAPAANEIAAAFAALESALNAINLIRKIV
jgi:hypothetical protein